MKQRTDTIYIGYDQREDLAYDVLVESIKRNTSDKFNIVPIIQNRLRVSGLYSRGFTLKGNQKYDYIDGRPFSTDFSFSRFLVPILNQFQGWALFMDCDMFIRSNIGEVFDLAKTYPEKALWCVKHDYNPKETIKMDGQIQERYSRKNWSSFVMWNCEHQDNFNLTVGDVNTKSGRWLHNFMWLGEIALEDDKVMSEYPELQSKFFSKIGEDLIGELDVEWNWLDGHSSELIDAKNVHFTTGGPWFDMWKPSQDVEHGYVEEWRKIAKDIQMEEVMG